MKFEDNQPLYQAPQSKSQAREAAKLAVGLGACTLLFALYCAIEGYPFSTTGKAKLLDQLLVAVFGRSHAEFAATELIAILGVAFIIAGARKWRAAGASTF